MAGRSKSGFTLIELMTVLGMLLVLIGAIASSVTAARKRAKVQQAITEAQEMTNAILAYENYGKAGGESPLEAKVTGDTWKEATESDLAFILGKESMPNGQQGNVPVLFNAAVYNGKVLDPWGHPYRFRVISGKVESKNNSGQNSATAAFALPNINRIPADEENR